MVSMISSFLWFVRVTEPTEISINLFLVESLRKEGGVLSQWFDPRQLYDTLSVPLLCMVVKLNDVEYEMRHTPYYYTIFVTIGYITL